MLRVRHNHTEFLNFILVDSPEGNPENLGCNGSNGTKAPDTDEMNGLILHGG